MVVMTNISRVGYQDRAQSKFVTLFEQDFDLQF